MKHTLPSGEWPTRAEAERSLLFSKIRLGQTELEHRTWIPAMVPWRASEDGDVTPEVLDWYRRFARGRPAGLVVEATGIRDVPSGPLLRIGHDRFLPGLKELVRTVHEASDGQTRLFIQVIDFLRIRRRPAKAKFFERFLEIGEHHLRGLEEHLPEQDWQAASEETVRAALLASDDETLEAILTERELEAYAFGARERVWDTDQPHIRELPCALPGLFASAAARAREAGFDGVELHYAHAYTMASFLSRLNTRTDGYGGSKEHRIRLPLEVYRAVRERAGNDYTVGVRFLGDEAIAGGSPLEDAVFFGTELARAGFDYLSISKGGKFEDARQPKVGEAAYPYTGPSGHECMPTVHIEAPGPFSRQAPLAKAIRSAVRESGFDTPVIVAGGICSFGQAEALLANGTADLVAAARQSLADPDWFLKMRLGQGAAIRRCKFTNYCEALDQRHLEVTCQLWDREDRAGGGPRSRDDRRWLLAPSWEGCSRPTEG
ncbi:MAG: NADH:flavin oxidoreductase [Planctomycetota bacterium]